MRTDAIHRQQQQTHDYSALKLWYLADILKTRQHCLNPL